MDEKNKIRIDNVKEAVKNLDYGFRFTIGIIIVITLILVKNDVELKQNIEIPFINIVAPSLLVAFISLILYLLVGISMLHFYSVMNRNLILIKYTNEEDFNSLLIQPSIWISGHRITRCLIILCLIAIFTIVLLPTWPNLKWTKSIIVPLSMSIPYFILIFRIYTKYNWQSD